MYEILKHKHWYTKYPNHNFKCVTACLEGFTSDIGQKCRPCSNNTFGERCRGECVCSNYEMCAKRLKYIIFFSYYVQIYVKTNEIRITYKC